MARRPPLHRTFVAAALLLLGAGCGSESGSGAESEATTDDRPVVAIDLDLCPGQMPHGFVQRRFSAATFEEVIADADAVLVAEVAGPEVVVAADPSAGSDLFVGATLLRVAETVTGDIGPGASIEYERRMLGPTASEAVARERCVVGGSPELPIGSTVLLALLRSGDGDSWSSMAGIRSTIYFVDEGGATTARVACQRFHMEGAGEPCSGFPWSLDGVDSSEVLAEARQLATRSGG